MLFDPKWEKKGAEVQVAPWGQLLIAAASLIEQRGLSKGCLLGLDGSLCTMGALQEISHDFELIMRCVTELKRFLKTEHIPSWNDARYRSKSDVVGALRACAGA